MAHKDDIVSPTRVSGAVAGYIGYIAKATDDYTLGAQQILLLLALHIQGEVNQTDLPKYTGVNKSANARNIARLGSGAFVAKPGQEQKEHKGGLGLVVASDDPLNLRYKKVRLTPKGLALMDEAARAVAHML